MLDAQVAVVRQALAALYSHDGATRKAADHWLQSFRTSSGAWRLCLGLLSRPGLAEHEYHFAAHVLRVACGKVQDVLDPAALPGLAAQLATLLLASASTGAWPVAGQLSSALAALAVRAGSWAEESLVPQLLSLLAPQLAAAMLAGLAMGGVGGLGGAMGVGAGGAMGVNAMGGIGVVGVGGQAGGAAAVVAAAVASEPSAVYSLLQVVTCLPEACASRAVSSHPARKAALVAALAADATVAPLLHAAVVSGGALAAAAAAGGGLGLGLGVVGHLGPAAAAAAAAAATALAGGGLPRPGLRRAGLQLLHAWAEQLGAAPRGLEHDTELINALYEALVTPDTAPLASECLVGLIATCAPAARAAAGSSPAQTGQEDGYASDTSSASASAASLSGQDVAMGGVRQGAAVAAGGHGPMGHGHNYRRPNWGEAAGFRKAGGRGPGPSGGGASGSGMGGAAAVAAAAPPSPERQLAAALLLGRLLDGLQTLLSGAEVVYREQSHQAASAAAVGGGGGDGGAAAAAAPPGCGFWSLWSDGPVLQAVCNVLCSAAAAVLPAALRGEAGSQGRFAALWPHLMALLGHSNPEVALSCVSFWQDTYLAKLVEECGPGPGPQHAAKQPPQHAAAQQAQHASQQAAAQRSGVLGSHLPLLAQLLTGLVSRAALRPDTAAAATADARDLPEDVRMVRRELGATMRDLVGLVGLSHVAGFLERMISDHAAQLGGGGGGGGAAAERAGGGAAGPSSLSPSSAAAAAAAAACVWTRLESSLYAANVALCGGGGAGGGGTRLSPAGSSPDSAPGPAFDAHVASILSTAAAAVVHPCGSLKLAGTALTLMGGLAPWLAARPAELARPLEAIRAALGSADEKLARNAATALNRLVAHPGCGASLLGRYAGWVAGLGPLLPGPEVQLRHRPAPGVDLSSRELLVASLMRLACSTPAAPPPPPQQQQQAPPPDGSPAAAVGAAGGVTPQVLLQQLLAPRVLAAATELERLAAATAAAASSGVLQAYLQIWRASRGSNAVAGVAQVTPGQSLGLGGAMVAHGSVGAPSAADEAQGARYRVPLCLPGTPAELQQLGAVASAAAQRLGGLASMLLFVPAAGQGQDTGAASGGGSGGAGGGAAAAGSARRGAADGARGPGDAAAAAAGGGGTGGGGTAAAVLPLVVQAVRAVWRQLQACLQPAAAAPAQPSQASQPQPQAQQPAPSLLLETVEGAGLLPAACSLLQGAMMVAAAALNAPAPCPAGPSLPPQLVTADQQQQQQQHPQWQQQQQQYQLQQHAAGAAELLSAAAFLLPAAHGSALLDPPEAAAATQGLGGHGAHGHHNAHARGQCCAGPCHHPPHQHQTHPHAHSHSGQHLTRGAQILHQHQHQHHLQHAQSQGQGQGHGPPGPPVCVLQLVQGCLPVCCELMCGRAAQALALAGPGGQAEQAAVAGGGGGGGGGGGAAAARAVAEEVVRASCVVVRQGCVCLQLPRPGTVGPDSERLLHCLPVWTSLLLHTPQALAASRELIDSLVAATVRSMHCAEPEACRALLDWTQLLLCCTAFAAQALAAAGGGGSGSGSGRSACGAAVAAAIAATSSGGSGAAAAAGQPQPLPSVSGAVKRDGMVPAGLAALLARVRHAPALAAAYGGVAAQLDAPAVCCAPDGMGLVVTLSAAEAAAAAAEAALGLPRQAPPPSARPVGAAVGNLGSALTHALMAAAAGGMPSDLMLPISTCLHGAWQAMGDARFRAWLRAATTNLSCGPAAAAAAAAAAAQAQVMLMSGHGGVVVGGGHVGGLATAAAAAAAAAPPWARLQPESLAAALSELWGEECERDVMRFKRALKALCGGKKKGTGGGF